MKRWIGLAFALASAVAMAQVTTPTAEEKKAAEKKAAEKKAAEKKAAEKKAPPKKSTPPAKAPARKPADPPKATANPNVKVYKANDPNAPKVKDKDGNVIPTNPDAYDISSAVKKK